MSRALTGPLSFGLSKAIARPEGVGYPAGTIFVSKSATNGFAAGNDSNTSTQAQDRLTPWATISKAVASAPLGSLVVVNDGIYSGLELGALNYVLLTSTQTLRFKAHRRRQVAFLGTVATAIVRQNSAPASGLSSFEGIVFDGDAVSDYAILDNTISGVVHTLTFTDCQFLDTNFHGITGSATKPTINLIGCDHSSATRGYISMTALSSGAAVNIVGGTCAITAMATAASVIALKATTSGASVSITGGFDCDVTLSSGLTGNGAHDAIVLTNISTATVTDNSVSLLGHPGTRSGGCIIVTADAAIDVAATVTGNTVYNETTGGYGIVVGADGTSSGNARVIDPVVTDNTVTAVPANQATAVHGIIAGFNIGGSILRNTIIGCGLALIQKMNTVRGALFANNTLRDFYSIGMYAKGAVDTRFVHNSGYVTDTAHGSDAVTAMQALTHDDATTHSTGIEFTDNAIDVAGNVLTKFVSVGASNTATFANNLYHSDFALPANPFTYQGTSYASVALWAAAKEATAIDGDPLFTDAANDNFTLQAGSAAIGAGVAASGVTTDKAGVTYASPPSIGAYEYVA